MRLLVTGGAGFIGCNFIRMMLRESEHEIVNLDKLTYAGNAENLRDVEGDGRYGFVKADVCDAGEVGKVMGGVDAVVHFAAESHVDRSIQSGEDFVRSNVYGTYVMLEKARGAGVKRFVHISTDEVYGSVDEGRSREEDALRPNSPYSASKASADMLCRAWHETYGFPVIVVRSSNNFGPYQHPEKLIPKFVSNALQGKKLPLYGDGKNLRDWLYVEDNCRAIRGVLEKGEAGEIYNVGAGNERSNIEITKTILELTGKDEGLIEYVADRAGHDRRYALDTGKVRKLGWRPRYDFSEAMGKTVEWYGQNAEWLGKVRS